MEKLNIIFGIIASVCSALGLIILCIDILPKWWTNVFGGYKISIISNVSTVNIYVSYHKKFAVNEIFLSQKPNIFRYNCSTLHGHTTPFKYMTYGQIINNHHIAIDIIDLSNIATNNQDAVKNNQIKWGVTLISEDGKTTEETFSLPVATL